MGNPDNSEFHNILNLINRVKKADDLRWLARYMAIEAGEYPNLRGIQFFNYDKSELVEQILVRASSLEKTEYSALAKVLNMLYEAVRPKRDNSRGVVELKSVTKEYPEIDWETKLPIIDANGNMVTMEFTYTYAYVRVHGNKGDMNRKGHKLLSLYADRGMGRGGTGGYVAAALLEGLVTEDEILDAFHSGDSLYEVFIDQCANLLQKPSQTADLSHSLPETPIQDVDSKPTTTHPAKPRAGIGYQFRIELLGIKPTIWRRFSVPGNITFTDLHRIVQLVMGWESYHLFQFSIGGSNFVQDAMGPDDKYASAPISKYINEPGIDFYYEYDFGDQWPHNIVLEKILKSPPDVPKCSAGKRACPPEDSGGIEIYGAYLKAKKKRRIPQYLKEHVGHPFDPEAFDLAEINENLTEFWQENQKLQKQES